MTYITEREKVIVMLLKEGLSVRDIGIKLNTPMTSISRSITSIRRKAQDIQEDVTFFKDVGFLRIEDGELLFLSPDRDPKFLGKKGKAKLRK